MNPIKLRRNNYSWAAPIYDRCGQLYSFGAIGASKEATLENCPANSSILLLGCGTAEEAVKAARRGCRLHLVDQSEAMLARARSRFAQEANPPIFSKVDIFDWQCDQKFDFIVANYFLNVFSKEDVSKLFLKMNSWLKDGGRIVISDFAPAKGALGLMQNLYYALPLSVFYFLSKNAWHGIYDYEQIAKDCELQLESTQSYKLCGLFPAYQKWTLKKVTAQEQALD